MREEARLPRQRVKARWPLPRYCFCAGLAMTVVVLFAGPAMAQSPTPSPSPTASPSGSPTPTPGESPSATPTEAPSSTEGPAIQSELVTPAAEAIPSAESTPSSTPVVATEPLDDDLPLTGLPPWATRIARDGFLFVAIGCLLLSLRSSARRRLKPALLEAQLGTEQADLGEHDA